MNDFYTFIVSSTINSPNKTYTREERFEQTIKTLESICSKVDNAKIIFIDNSIETLTEEQQEIIKPKVDLLHILDHNIVTLYFNRIYSKGLGEIFLMYEALKLIDRNDLIGKRIFKLSGRYRLAESFDISAYEDPSLFGKYVARINPWDVFKDNKPLETVWYFETRLWSMCGSLFEDFKNEGIHQSFNYMSSVDANIEKAYLHALGKHTVEFKPIHVEGNDTENAVYRFE